MPTKQRMSETDLAAHVAAALESHGWTVHQEVAPWGGGAPCLDILAAQGAVLWAVECKVAFGTTVADQALVWRPHAHRVSVATMSRRDRSETLCLGLASQGIGRIEVFDHRAGKPLTFRNEDQRESLHQSGHIEVFQTAAPALKQDVSDLLLKHLEKHHAEICAAGSRGGVRATPFWATAKRLAEFVAAHPGTCLERAVEEIEHHYSSDRSARASLAAALDRGIIPGVVVRVLPGPASFLYPAE